MYQGSHAGMPQEMLQEPHAEEFQAAILFADMSGFTPLTEKLCERGAPGVEALSKHLNDYFGKQIRIIHNVSNTNPHHSAHFGEARW